MNRFSPKALSVAAGLAIPAAAFGATVTSNFPLTVADVPTAGVNSTVSISVDETAAPANDLANGNVARVFVTVVSVDSAGAETVLVENIEVTAGAGGATLEADGTTDLEVDLSAFATNLTLAANAAPAGSVGVGLIFTVDDQAGAASTGIAQGGDFDTNGQPVAATDGFVFDNAPVTITDAFLDAANDKLFLVFSRSLNAGDNGAAPGGNDGNQTTAVEAGLLAAADVLIDNDNDFNDLDEAPINGGNFAAATQFLAGSNGTVLEITFNNANTNVAVGSFVRLADTGPADDITDILGNQANNNVTPAANAKGDEDGVQITALADLTITGVSFEETVTTDAAVPGAVRVQYNLPLNPADLGNDVFYSDFLQDANGATDLEIAAIAADPDDSAAVLLTIDRVDAAPDENVWSDGLDDDGNSFLLATTVTDALRNEPGSVFDGADAGVDAKDDYQAAAQSLTIADGIDPSVDGFAYVDQDGDGVLDGIAVFADEPVTASGAATGDFTINVVAGQALEPIALLDDEGDFPAPADLPTSAAGTITPTNLGAGNIQVTDGDAPARLSSGNGVILSLDPAAFDWTGDGAGVNRPGTGDPLALFTLDHPDFTLTDGAGNETDTGTGTGVALTEDRAAPVVANFWHLTGDNVNGIGSLDQVVAEADDEPGDQQLNDRLVFVFGEDVAFGSAADDLLNNLTVDGATWNATVPTVARDPFIIDGNKVSIENRREGGSPGFNDGDDTVAVSGYDVGSQVAFTASADVVDAADNVATASGTVVERTAPYIRQIEDRENPGQTLDSAFLLDDNGDGIADRVLVNFTEAIVAADLNADDFTVTNPASGVDVTAAQTATGNNETAVFLTLSGNVSMDSELEITYEGVDADTNDRLLTGAGSTNPVSPVASVFDVERVQEPATESQQIAIQTITGVGTDAEGNPFQVGTRVVAFLGAPTAKRISATHNNVDFRYDRAELNYTETIGSLEAFTNYLFGIHDFIYLNRSEGNNQLFVNEKDAGAETGANGDGFQFNTDILQIDLNASNLTNLSFNSSGEKSGNRASGDLTLCWDLFRSNNGTLENLFENGYEIGGEPIIAGETVVTQTDGSFVLHVSGPSARFWDASRISGVPLPIILVVEGTDGVRTAVTGMVNGVSGPLVFNPQNTRQNQDGTAPLNTTYNIDLANVGANFIFEQWSLLEFDRVGGYAQRTNDIPVLPSGVGLGDVETQSTVPLTDAFDQFAYFVDDNGDGLWTAADDNNDFDSLWIDLDCADCFIFTLDSNGVDTDGAAFVGGYAAAVYNGTGEELGAFQFGAELTSASIFDSAEPFPNNTTTLGWGLFTVTANRGGTVTETNLFTDNVGLDFAIEFENDGESIDVTNSAAEDVELESPQAIFGHYQR